MSSFQPTSWSQKQVRNDLGKCLYTFAVVADTHIEREGFPSVSPFPVNALSNARARYVFEDINRLSREMDELAPKFVVHLGDVVHPVPSLPEYVLAAKDSWDIMNRVDMPVYLVPGNHDVGDKPIDWAPAGGVCDEYLALWEEHFGVQYQAFDQGDCRFVLINAEAINSGLSLEQEQKDWLESEFTGNEDRRIFFFLHYPPYLADRHESVHYDNIDEPGRSWLLSLLEKHKVEALFAGHVHNYWYHRHDQTDCYLLSATCNVRQDHSEIFRASPPPEMESGRNDIWKVGYFIVSVYENGHVCHLQRSNGGLLELDETPPEKPAAIVPYHSREVVRPGLGFEMRHPWAEVTEVAPSGALDEFERKLVRNDYPLLALWDMGIQRVRIPLQDIVDERVRQRMRDLVHSGHEFTVLSSGLPTDEQRKAIIECSDFLDHWELALPDFRLSEAYNILRKMREKTSIPVYFCKIRTKADMERSGDRYLHFINHGFVPEDRDQISEYLAVDAFAEVFSGFVFRVVRDESPWDRVREIDVLSEALGIQSSITIMMADRNPALHQVDDRTSANRICESFIASNLTKNSMVFVDTFMDLDRGHSVRNGVIDRFCNPRAAYHVLRNLIGVFNRFSTGYVLGDKGACEKGKWMVIEDDEHRHVLVIPDDVVENMEVPLPAMGVGDQGEAQMIDLMTGELAPWEWSRPDEETIKFETSQPINVPTLFTFLSAASQMAAQ